LSPLGLYSCKSIWAGSADPLVLTKNSKGEYHFTMKAANGEPIAQSEMYNSKAAAKNGIGSVKANASSATIDDQTGE
jgi:uncharacterized protein YegP (UPF0339 family)